MTAAVNSQGSKTIRFLLNGEVVTVDDADPTQSVLYYLRENQKLTGTKEGCAEGDCGACTVVIGELNQSKGKNKVELKTVNACIQFVPTLDGKALFTVEHLRKANGDLHPVQQAMVDKHGSQCGFCTPGFIMSLWNLYTKHQTEETRPDRDEVKSALTGNLCRCTGYRPILDAADNMFELPAIKFEHTELQQQLQALQHDDSLNYESHGSKFFAPKNIKDMLELRAQYPQATILAGGTDVGLWVNKQFRDLGPIIYTGEVKELKQLEINNNTTRIGAAVTLTDAYQVIFEYYPEMDQMWERFASMPIRNVGTLGGNVANGSPIGDSMPALIALGARVVLNSIRGDRTLLLEDFYIDYMQKDMAEDEIVEAIELPLPSTELKTGQQFRCYKLSKRHDSDISAVFAAFAITLDGETVKHCQFVYGGMAAIPKRAKQCEQSIIGKVWDESTVRNAMKELEQDYAPMSDMRASDKNRMQSAQNLLYRFYLETRLSQPLSNLGLDVFAL